MKRIYLIAIAVLLLVASSLIGYRLSSRRTVAPPAPPPSEDTPEALITSPELKHTENGKLAWKVILEEMELDRGGTSVAVQGLREGLIYGEDGEPALRVTAQTVDVDTIQQSFRMSGEVVVTSPKGFVIRTENVDWFNDEKRINCPGHVLMKAKSLVISTTGLDYLLTPDQVNCPNQVRMYSGNTRLVGRSLTYDVKSGVADIIGGVQMVIDPEEFREVLKEWSAP